MPQLSAGQFEIKANLARTGKVDDEEVDDELPNLERREVFLPLWRESVESL